MAQTPDIKITVTPVVDTSAFDQLKAVVQGIGEGFAKVGEQMKPALEAITKPFQQQPYQGVTQEQICAAYGVPPEMVGLLPPDAGVSLLDGIKHGTLISNSEIHSGDWDGEVLPMGTCPSNGSPYVPGLLGPTAMLVNNFAPSPHTWEGKTTEQIMADIQKAADAYKGATVPKKVFPAKPPGEGSGIPAHAVFTSPLIHAQAKADVEEKAQKLLASTGKVKIAKLDEHGAPTGEWTDVGSAMDFKISYPTHLVDAEAAYQKAYTEQALKAVSAKEHEILGSYLGVDIGPDSGNTVTVATAHADPLGNLQITVTGPEGEPVKQTTVPQATVHQLMEAAWDAMTPDPSDLPAWNPASVGKLGDFAFQDLGHTEAVAEALKQKGKVDKLQTKLSQHASGLAVDINGPLASGGIMVAGGDYLHFEFDSPSMPSFPQVTAQKGGVKFPKPPDTWFGEDGQELVSTTSDQLFDVNAEPPPIHPLAHLWCTACDCHWMAHTGDPVACESGGYLRPSTPLEDKQYVDRVRMLKATGLK